MRGRQYRPFPCLYPTPVRNNRRNYHGRYTGQKVTLLANLESNFEITIFAILFNLFNNSYFNSVAGLLLANFNVCNNHKTINKLHIKFHVLHRYLSF